ncbi:MAG: C25 family cysteine peptidase, partial [Candidatus Delongbacteria bacterium]
MKHIFLHAILSAVICYGAEKIDLNNGQMTGGRMLDISSGHFEAEFVIGKLSVSEIKTETGEFIELDFEGSKNSHRVGTPQLPVFRELLQFPGSSTPVIKIVSRTEKEYFLDELGIKNRIIPSQPSYSKSTSPEMRKFVINENEYEEPGYKQNTLVSVKKSGNVRGVSIGVLEIEPVSYDPVNNSIKVVSDLKIRVEYSGGDINWEKTRTEQFSPYFEGHLKKCLNYTPLDSKQDITVYPVTYLIAANEVLENNEKLQEFTDWKIQKGFNVTTGFFPSTASVNDVDSWVENNYNILEPKPSFLLIIGDVSGTYYVPTEQNPALGSTGNVSVSDLIYGVIGETSESNRIPSIHVGRFSVNDLTELDAQIDKTLWYERGQFDSGADLSYLSKVMGVAGVDGSYADSHGNPQIHYGMDHYFNDQYQIPLDGSYAAITGLPYYYPETTNSSVDADIISNTSSGVAFYNYTAHGSPTAFSDPNFDIFDINSLENTGKYPLVVGNCCLTGSFGYQECFGEAWLNAADKGGIGFIGASMSTYWNEDLAMGVGTTSVINNTEPPLSQNEQGMYDGAMMMDYPTQSAVRFAGLLAVEQYGGSMVSPYWSAYHLFGDPSLMTYFGIPGENTVSHDPFISPGADTFTVQALEGSYVAVADSSSGALHGAARADRFGYAVVPIEPFLEGTAVITVT